MMNEKEQLTRIMAELSSARSMIDKAEERVMELFAKHSDLTHEQVKSIFKEAKEAVINGKN